MLPNQTEVIKRLSELSRLLDKATEDIAELDHDFVEKKAKFEKSYAMAFIESTGSMDLRKYEANLKCSNLKLEMELAEQVLRACKERINTLRAQISIGQSVSAALRTQFGAEATGQYT
jgi:SMC interacting uncharacterized protein involved in chromosome segregation